MHAARPLDCFPLVRARRVESAREALSRVYANNMTVDPLDRGGVIDVVVNSCQLPQIGLHYSRYGGGARIHFFASKFITLSFPLSGHGMVALNGSDTLIDPRCGLLTPAEMSFTTEISANYQHVVLKVDPKALESKLAALIGTPVHGPLAFEPLFSFSKTDAKLLRDHIFALVDTMSAPAARLPDLVRAEFEQSIMVMFLRASRHGCSHLLDVDAPEAAPVEVRRAEGYIEANWRQPITLEALAAVSGVSAFSLFRAFKKYRGYSPMQFAEQIRSRERDLH